MNRRDAFRAAAACVLGAPIAADAVINYVPKPPLKYVYGVDVGAGGEFTALTAFAIEPSTGKEFIVFNSRWTTYSIDEITGAIREVEKSTNFTLTKKQPSGCLLT